MGREFTARLVRLNMKRVKNKKTERDLRMDGCPIYEYPHDASMHDLIFGKGELLRDATRLAGDT